MDRDSLTTAPLPRARRLAFERLVSGRPPEAVAAELGWTPARVIREASAAALAAAPETLARLTDAEREAEIRHLLGLDPEPPASPPTSSSAQAATSEAPATVISIPERPRRHPDLLIEEGPPGEGFSVVSDAERSIYLRLKAPQAAFLAALDGTRGIEGLAAAGVDERLVLPLLARFTQLGLLEGTEPPVKANQRVRAGDKSRLQYTFADPDGLLDRLLPLIRVLGSPVGLALAALACAAALVVFAVRADLSALTAGFVADPLVIATVVVATLATVVLHELGHASAVKFHGGRVHRLGFMLFYLAPAMFCDTSDSWRFPRRAQRAAVSMAGIGVQFVVTALVVLALALPLPRDLNAWITLYAFINFGMCILNAIPFVKLDGYWTLVAVTDRPNLRAEAMGRVREHVRRAVFGVRRPLRPVPAPWAQALFGLACIVFAPLLVLTILLRYQGWLLGWGWMGASSWLLLAAVVALGPVHGTLRAFRSVPLRARLRGAALVTAALAAIVGAATLVKLPLGVEGDFTRTGPRSVTVELLEARAPLVRPGDRVQLDDGSFAAPVTLGRGTVERVSGGRAQVRLERPVEATAGHARVQGRERSAPRWFLDMYIVPPVRGL